MIVSTRTIAVCLLACFLGANAVVLADGPFKDLSYKKALEQAAKDKTVVFIDFYTTWCGPCKMMDASTFKDGKVVKWLTEKAVSLKVDAERDLDLAEKFKVEFYPTLVFVKPDGTEFERMSGYLSPEEFLEVTQAVEKGESILDQARRNAAASPDDPFKKLELAGALSMRGHYDEAMELLVWCLDHGVEKDKAFADVRDSAVIGLMAQVAQSHEPARDDLIARRDSAEKRILSGSPVGVDIAMYVVVNQLEQANERTLATYDKVTASESNRETASLLAPHVFPVLLDAKRYEDIARSVDLVAKAEEIRSNAGSLPDDAQSDMPADQVEAMTAMMRQGSVYELAAYYQVLIGLGRTEQAARVAELALELDDSAETYNALAWSGYLTGRPLPENLTQAEKAWKLDGEKSVSIFDTLVRVMHARGQSTDAIKMCETFLAKAVTEQDKWLIRMCLDEFRTGAAN